MSNAIITTTATLPATTGKLFKGFNVSGFIGQILPYADTEAGKPSLIRMNSASATSALGGKTTAPAFITGLLYMLAAHAYGQKVAQDMASKLPSYSAHCLLAGASMLPKGKGCTVASLKGAAEHAVNALLTLPAKKITVQRTAPAKTIELPDANTADRSYMAQDAMLCNPTMDAEEQSKRYAGHYLRQSQGATAARLLSPAWREASEEAEKAEWRASQAEIRAADAMQDRAIAVQEFIKLADFLGVKLSAAQRKLLVA